MDAKGAAEAALFASPENLRISDIAERTGFPEEEIRTALMDLRREYEERDSAIVIAKIGSEYGMMLRAEYSDFPGMFGKAEMSGGLMRTLSAIAYNQPVSRAFIEQVRGVDSSSSVSGLLQKGLIEEAGRLDLPGHPVSFRTTDVFLRCFGLSSLADLPPVRGEQEGEAAT